MSGDAARLRALVISSDPQTAATLLPQLAASGFVATAATPDLIPEGKFDVVLFGTSALGSLGAPSFAQRFGAASVLLLNEGAERTELLSRFATERPQHLVSVDGVDLQSLLAGNRGGIEALLAKDAYLKTFTFQGPVHKPLVLEGVEEVATRVGCHPRVKQLLLIAVDEMVINALYRAPAPAGPQKPVTVECGADGHRLAVSVVDEHGRLSADDFYRGLGRREVERTGERAGAGFRMMLEGLTQLYVHLDKGRRTELVGLLDLSLSLQGHRKAAPVVHLFDREDGN